MNYNNNNNRHHQNGINGTAINMYIGKANDIPTNNNSKKQVTMQKTIQKRLYSPRSDTYSSNNYTLPVDNHSNMYITGAQPLGGWDDSLGRTGTNQILSRNNRRNTKNSSKQHNNNSPPRNRPVTTPLKYKNTVIIKQQPSEISSLPSPQRARTTVGGSRRKRNVKIYGRPRTRTRNVLSAKYAYIPTPRNEKLDDQSTITATTAKNDYDAYDNDNISDNEMNVEDIPIYSDHIQEQLSKSMILETAEKFQQNVFQNKTAVLKHFIEHRRTLETRAKKEWQRKNHNIYYRKKNRKIHIQGESNKLSIRKERKISKREKRRRKRMEGHGWKRREPYRYPNIIRNSNNNNDYNMNTTNSDDNYNSNYYSPIKNNNNRTQHSSRMNNKYDNNQQQQTTMYENIEGVNSTPYKPYESYHDFNPSSRGRLTRGRLVPAFIQYKPEPPPPDLKERPLTRRPLSKHSNRIPVGFRDKVGHFVDPKFNPNDRYYGENVEGLIDSIMGVPVGTVR